MSLSNGDITPESEDNFFDLKVVHEHFTACLTDNEDIALDGYINAYKELNKFCYLMGSVFGFVGTEINSKMEVLEQLRRSNEASHFVSLKQMVQYEKESSKMKDRSYVSGSRTLLRLHRGLEFLKEFLKEVGELQPNDKTNKVGQDVYHRTLAKHHPWLIRKGAVVAMWVLPTRDALLNKVCGKNAVAAVEALPIMLQSTNEVYNRTEQFFKDNDLLNLP